MKKSGFILWGLFSLMMFVGLPLLIYYIMDKHSSRHGQRDALLYELNGVPVLATVTERFAANEVSDNVVSGSTRLYAQAIDLKNGKLLWSRRMKAKHPVNGSDWGRGFLLGQSDKYLFFCRNDLYILDKTNGKEITRGSEIPALKDKLPEVNSDAGEGYHLIDSLHSLLIRANDGLAYLLDINTLQVSTADVNAAAYFEKLRVYRFMHQAKTLQPMSFTRRHDTLLAFMDDADLQQISHDVNIAASSQAAPRRRLVRSTDAAVFTPLGSHIFIFGGFLPLPSTNVSLQENLPVMMLRLAVRGGEDGTPFLTSGQQYVVMHRQSTASNAAMLLSLVSPQGDVRWTLNTGLPGLVNVYRDAHGMLVVLAAGIEKGPDKVDDILYINPETGACNGYHFRKQSSFTLSPS